MLIMPILFIYFLTECVVLLFPRLFPQGKWLLAFHWMLIYAKGKFMRKEFDGTGLSDEQPIVFTKPVSKCNNNHQRDRILQVPVCQKHFWIQYSAF